MPVTPAPRRARRRRPTPENRPEIRPLTRPGPETGPSPLTADRLADVDAPTEVVPIDALPTHVGAALDDPAAGRQFIASAVHVAVGSLQVLAQGCDEVAHAFRWDDASAANARLADLIEGTRTLVRLAGVASQAAGLDLVVLCRRNGATLDPLDDTREALEQLIHRQMAADWSAMADALEEYLRPALERWESVFTAIGRYNGSGIAMGLAS